MHKTNQSGKSSKEISDIDVFFNSELKYTIEVKDKVFTQYDVEHAVTKAMDGGARSLIFAMGDNAQPDGFEIDLLVRKYKDMGFNLTFTGIHQFYSITLCLIPFIDKELLIAQLNKFLDDSKIKDETYQHLISCLKLVC